MNIYVASSWRNIDQPLIVEALREDGHEVYDFHNPAPGDHGFHWSEIDPEWKDWSAGGFAAALKHPVPESAFRKDMEALDKADMVVLVMPCGRSAHLELGYAIGKGKITAILLDSGDPELTYKMADELFVSLDELRNWLDSRTAKESK